MQDLKEAQSSESSNLQSMLVDPAVNMVFQSMKTELKESRDKLQQAQNDLSAWKFTPDRCILCERFYNVTVNVLMLKSS